MIERLILDDLLMAHAAGKLAEPVALVVASHLALSPASRSIYRRYEHVGGTLLDQIEECSLRQDAWTQIEGRLDDVDEERPATSPSDPTHIIPPPLRPYLREGLEQLSWRHYGAASEADLEIDDRQYRARLIRVKAGRAVPRHTHDGQELTLVLDGAFHDMLGRFERGDLAIADPSIDHQPVADPARDCLCLAVTDAPLRLTGVFGRFLNPFLRL
jgi:putative transcriptional regulator